MNNFSAKDSLQRSQNAIMHGKNSAGSSSPQKTGSDRKAPFREIFDNQTIVYGSRSDRIRFDKT